MSVSLLASYFLLEEYLSIFSLSISEGGTVCEGILYRRDGSDAEDKGAQGIEYIISELHSRGLRAEAETI